MFTIVGADVVLLPPLGDDGDIDEYAIVLERRTLVACNVNDLIDEGL